MAIARVQRKDAPVLSGPERDGLGRALGLDAARAVALMGMFVAHTWWSFVWNPATEAISFAAAGRSSILFATLAGVSLAILSGGTRPLVGGAGKAMLARLVIRLVILLLIGTLLTALRTPVAVILAYYGIFFLVAVPFLWLRPRVLLILAVLGALLAPIVSFAIRRSALGQEVIAAINAADPLHNAELDGLTSFLLVGAYPALTWVPIVIAGLYLGRIGIAHIRRSHLMAMGVGMAVLGYGGSWVALQVAGEGAASDSKGPSPLHAVEWRDLLAADGHAGTTFEIVGSVGIALVVLTVCLWGAERAPKLLRPLTAMGSMSLTIYTAHVILLAAIPTEPNPDLFWFLPAMTLAAMAFAFLWLRFAVRGPLESILHWMTRLLVPRGQQSTRKTDLEQAS